MKIKVTEERDCCEERDLRLYRGDSAFIGPAALDLSFCIHCGQRWKQESFTDSAGDSDRRWVRCQ